MNILKYIRKYITPIILSFIIIFSSVFSTPLFVYAEESTSSDYNWFQDNIGKVINFTKGVLINTRDLGRDFIDFLSGNLENDETPEEFINDNVTLDGDNVDIDGPLINLLNSYVNDYVNDSDYFYAYTFDVADYFRRFDSLDQYNAFRNFVATNETNYHCLYSAYSNGFILVPNDFFNAVVVGEIRTTYYDCNIFNNWVRPSSVDFPVYKYNEYSKTYTQSVDVSSYPSSLYFPLFKFSSGDSGINLSNMNYHQVNTNRTAFLVYKTSEAMQNGSVGLQDYYITDSYNQNISGSYNTTTTELNNQIDYGDVSNYINNYYNNNGSYPTPTQITIYINTYDPNPTPTPNPSPGPNPDNPGDDGEDDNNGIWGLIQKILDFISHIFDLVTNFLADQIDNLGDIVSSLISSIFNVFDSIKDGIPNVVGHMIKYLLPFLPEEMTIMIEFFIVLSIIYGIIKLIRGS